MRKGIALGLAFLLPLVASVPLVPKAAACAMQDAMPGMHHAAPGAAKATAGPDAGTHCTIECGCGCHRNIDSLPPLLAPHAPAGARLAAPVGLEPAGPAARELVSLRFLKLPAPPPKR